ncbi:MAG TPA: response regulator [Steroidobacteraceae bacterium]|jgi:PAS domain S-box-containing protein|nr:response regulator [Steroidobacteraceae bacterium]
MIDNTAILNAKILIVDDLEANVQLLEQMLRNAGYTAISSTMNPKEVSALHYAKSFDLILLDLLMPGMDGFQVMADLKLIENRGYLPVLVITAQPDHKLRALQAGAKDFVSKPFDLVEVTTRIHNMLEVRLLYQQLERHNQQLELTVASRTVDLRESEARFRRMTDLSTDWYWEQDVAGRVTQVSGPALEMLGRRSNDFPVGGADNTGVRWNEVERAALEENITARRPFLDLIYSRTNANGSLQYFQVSGEPIFDVSGCYTGYRGVGMDVTAHMRLVAVQAQP